MLFAISAAVAGEISPILFVPSVSSITTRLFALLSCSFVKDVANPIPMAVPSSISPLAAISVRTLCRSVSKVLCSTVIGHCVNASPAKIVSPILSFSRFDTNSAAVFLAASRRFGLRSCRSILVDTSMDIMISIPSTVFVSNELCICGLAMAVTIRANVSMRNTMGTCSSHILQLLGANLYAFVSLIRMVGSVFLLKRKYHNKYGMSRSSNRKYSLLANSIFRYFFFTERCHLL